MTRLCHLQLEVENNNKREKSHDETIYLQNIEQNIFIQ